MTPFNKAIVGAVTTGGAAFAAFTSSCSSVFAVFGTNSTTAQILSALILGAIGGGLVWLTPNKAASA